MLEQFVTKMKQNKNKLKNDGIMGRIYKNPKIILSESSKKPATIYLDKFEVFIKDGIVTIKKRNRTRTRYTPTLRKEEYERNKERGMVYYQTGRPIRNFGTFNPILKKYVGYDRVKEPDELTSSLIVTCFCGKEFETTDTRKIWCSRKCKDAHRNKNILYVEKVSHRLCPFCGEWYKPKQIRSQTCGKAKCRTRLSRKNERRKNIEVS